MYCDPTTPADDSVRHHLFDFQTVKTPVLLVLAAGVLLACTTVVHLVHIIEHRDAQALLFTTSGQIFPPCDKI